MTSLRARMSAFFLSLILALAGTVYLSAAPADSTGQTADSAYRQTVSVAPALHRVFVALPDHADDGLPPAPVPLARALTGERCDTPRLSAAPTFQTWNCPPARGPPGLAI